MGKQRRKSVLSVKLLPGMIAILVVGVIFFLEALQCFSIIYNWNYSGILEYNGRYTYSEEHYLRNTNYEFVLENGDVLIIPCEHVVNDDFGNYPILLFKYSSNKSLFTLGKHRILSIQSQDENFVFLKEDTITREIYIGAIGFMVVGISCMFISFLPFYPSLAVFIAKTSSQKK